MKPFAAQSYYELLEISVSASPQEIRSAWERLNRMYADDQVALYGLANPGTAVALRKRLREAMEVLTDDELRAVYDEEIGLPARDLTVEEPVTNQLEMGELLRGADHSLASTHPRVAFRWTDSSPGLQPVASPPRPPTVVPPRVIPLPVALTPPAAEPPPPTPVEPLPPVEVAPAPRSSAPAASEAERISEETAISMMPRPSPSARPSAPGPAPSAPDRPRLPDIAADAEYNGELLRKVRTALGLSLSVVAERTRIGSKHLENVEADRYDALPATVYLRGILMSLAKELRLDGLKVSRSYLSLVERIRSKG